MPIGIAEQVLTAVSLLWLGWLGLLIPLLLLRRMIFD